MNDSIRVMHRPRRAWPPGANRGRHHRRGRPGPADGGMRRQPVIHRFRRLIECGRVSDLTAAGQRTPSWSPSPTACVHTACRTSPTPSSGARGPKVDTAQQLGVSSSQLQAAQNACQHLLPNTGNIDDNPAALHLWWSQMLHFARCMHSHGVPNWPDPAATPRGALVPASTRHQPDHAFAAIHDFDGRMPASGAPQLGGIPFG